VKNEMGGTYSAYGGEFYTGFLWGTKPQERVLSLCTTLRRIGGANAYLHSFLTYAVDEDECLTSQSDSFAPQG
jgi:hypothetical protein